MSTLIGGAAGSFSRIGGGSTVTSPVVVADQTAPASGLPRLISRLTPLDKVWVLIGQTLDSTGAPLGLVAIKVFKRTTDTLIASGASDVSGNYSITIPFANANDDLYAVGYLTGSPDSFGTTFNTLRAA